MADKLAHRVIRDPCVVRQHRGSIQIHALYWDVTHHRLHVHAQRPRVKLFLKRDVGRGSAARGLLVRVQAHQVVEAGGGELVEDAVDALEPVPTPGAVARLVVECLRHRLPVVDTVLFDRFQENDVLFSGPGLVVAF